MTTQEDRIRSAQKSDARKQAVLFDNDGILVDTERLYFQANAEIFADAGLELTPEIYDRFYLQQNCGAWHLAERAGIDPESFPAMREARNVRYSELLRTEEILIPGAIETVAALAKTHIVGVVTSSRRDHFNLIHGRTGLLAHFHFVVAEGDFSRSKPDPEPYLAGVKRTGLDKSKCLAVEDTLRGLTAAKAAGIACWVVPSELTRHQDFSAADRRLERLEQVIELLAL